MDLQALLIVSKFTLNSHIGQNNQNCLSRYLLNKLEKQKFL